MSQQYPFQCNIAQALNIIGDKWSLLILQRFIPEASAPLPLYTYTCWRGFEYRF